MVDACGREPHSLRVRISPRTPQACRLVAQLRQRQRAQTAFSVGSNPTEPTKCAPVVQPGRDNRLKSGVVLVQIQPGAPDVPVADGEANGFQTRDWVFESPPGRHAPQQQVVSGRAANSVCAVQIRGGAPSSSYGGVDELLKSPVLKTGVSLQGPPRVEFPLPAPMSRYSSDVKSTLKRLKFSKK